MQKIIQKLCWGRAPGADTVSNLQSDAPFKRFLKLGPFNIEHAVFAPFRIVIHDFFTHLEMDWVRAYSSPLLSSIRDDQYLSKNTIYNDSSSKRLGLFARQFKRGSTICPIFRRQSTSK